MSHLAAKESPAPPGPRCDSSPMRTVAPSYCEGVFRKGSGGAVADAPLGAVSGLWIELSGTYLSRSPSSNFTSYVPSRLSR